MYKIGVLMEIFLGYFEKGGQGGIFSHVQEALLDDINSFSDSSCNHYYTCPKFDKIQKLA